MQLSELVAQFKEYNPNADTAMLEKAYRFAQNAHKDQKRETGEPYFNHCCAVAQILLDFKMDEENTTYWAKTPRIPYPMTFVPGSMPIITFSKSLTTLAIIPAQVSPSMWKIQLHLH